MVDLIQKAATRLNLWVQARKKCLYTESRYHVGLTYNWQNSEFNMWPNIVTEYVKVSTLHIYILVSKPVSQIYCNCVISLILTMCPNIMILC